MDWLGLDIGGANLKAADGLGYAIARPFALWKQAAELPGAIRDLLETCPAADALAVTMTGELADCFSTKAEGVAAILAAVDAAAGRRTARAYLTDGRFVVSQEAMAQPLLAAASNWHALARFAARYVAGRTGLLIDVGSTTTDIIPIRDGAPVARGRTDPERLCSGELVYTGVERSPVCAIVESVPWRGRPCRVAQELFATAWDAYLVIGDLPEEPHATRTADNRPATRAFAYDRLARAICADRTLVDEAGIRAIAEAVAESQLRQISCAGQGVIERLGGGPDTVIVSGQGEFLARRAAACLGWSPAVVSLAERLGPRASQAAAAHALAVLAREECAL